VFCALVKQSEITAHSKDEEQKGDDGRSANSDQKRQGLLWYNHICWTKQDSANVKLSMCVDQRP